MCAKTMAKTIVISTLLIISSISIKAQLHANFTTSTVSGCYPIVVQFTDATTGGTPTSWKWDLGNGTTSFLQNPSVTYFTPGQYDIKLVVKNSQGQDSIVKYEYITVYDKPTINFTASNVTGCFPMPVQFNDLSNPGSGEILSWQWDFGDGFSSDQQNPSHIYTAGGNYNVSLRVINEFGCSNSITRPQYIKVNAGARANFTHSAPTSCTAPININFTNTSTGSQPLTYQWNFGDGVTSSEANPSHNYGSAGSYTVTLITTNSSGCSDTIVKPNTVVIGTVRANFTTPENICAGTPVVFSNTSTPAGVGASWNFGDGTTSTDANPSKTFSLPGTYTIKLVSTSGTCGDSFTRNITVLSKPTAQFISSATTSCSYPFSVTFTNQSSNALTYSWDFGDGETSTEANPSHVFTRSGSFTVKLTATNSNGCTDVFTMTEPVVINPPVGSINELPQEGCAPLSWDFTSSVTASEPIASYLWNFGDGETSTDQNPTHIFQAGTFDITLRVTTVSGCTDSVKVTEGIRAGIKPIPAFAATPRITCAKTPVVFSDSTVGDVDRWLWDFGDGATSTLQNPTHKYKDTGYFTIKLYVWNMGCEDSLIVENYIRIDPPIAAIKSAFVCSNPMQYTFTDKSIAATSILWDFGNGITSTASNPVHVYTTPGRYRVTLIAYNSETGCSDTTSKNIYAMNERASFSTPDTVVCKKYPVPFTADADASLVSTYTWNFGDGGVGTGKTVHHSYQTTGTYTVTLIVKNLNGCYDTLVKTNYIKVNGPTAKFQPNVPGSCNMTTITFIDQSTAVGSAINSWSFAYGDGIRETYTGAPFSHLYTTPGNYNVTMTVKDEQGCVDSITKNSVVKISNPRAAFSSPDSLTCPGRSINFTNQSSGPSLTFNWNFGDGTSSTDRNPTHEYAADGNYTITLTVTDAYGCVSTITKENYIKIVTPEPAFSVSDTLGTCPPLVVNFTNQATNYTSYTWDFGDGSTSNALNPSHFYANPGVYNAVLSATGPGGCTSQRTKTIVVRGPQGTFSYPQTTGCDPLTVRFTATTLDRVSFIWDFNDGSTVSTIDSVISHTYTQPGYYIPKMILLDAGGCIVPIRGRDTIWVKGVNASFTKSTVTLCDSGTVRFTNTTSGTDDIASYSWNFGDGTTSVERNPSHTYTRSGIYIPKLTVISVNGCRSEFVSPDPVKVVMSPKIAGVFPADGCAPLSATFHANIVFSDTSALSWNWHFGNGNQSDVKNPPAQTYTNAGNYNVRVIAKNSSGCADTATHIIKSFAIPQIRTASDVLVCKGTGKVLTATGGATYSWSPATGLSDANIANPVANPASNITYTVTGTSAEGCSSTATTHIEVANPITIISARPTQICEGGFERIYASGADSYSWSPAAGLSDPNIANPVASPTTTTNYMVVGKDAKNCFTDTAYVRVKVYPIPTVEAGEDKTVNVGQSVDLIPRISSDVTRVVWSPTSGIYRNTYPGITVKPTQTTVYRVEVSNEGGCAATDNLTVNVICNNANVFIPNTFSPNADGVNDIFYPRGTGLFRIKSAKIFSRWGEIVYEKNDFTANDPTKGWDGTFKGKQLSPDVYVYVIEVMCDNNNIIPFKGNVALIR